MAVSADAIVMSYKEAEGRAEQRRALCRTVKDLLVDRLDLPVEADWITDDQPMFGRGLELDSVDALELAVGVEYSLEVTITDDDVGALGSVNAIVDFIESQGIESVLDAASQS